MKCFSPYSITMCQKSFKHLGSVFMLLCMFVAATLVSCSKGGDDPDDTPSTKEKTIFVYMPWTGSGRNLYDFFVNNIKDMKKGIVEQGGLNNTNLLVLIANSMDKSHLINVTYRDGKCYNDTLKTYDDGAMDTSDKMAALLNKVAEVAPAHIYSMMIGSHGVGWIYAEKVSESVQRRIAADRDRNKAMGLPITRQSRYFGGGAVQMNIDDLAEGIRRSKVNHLQFLLFDDCYMANIETAYELNRVTDYLIGCPTEIMGHGMPYREMWKYLSPTQPDYKNAVESFYNFYSNYSIGSTDYHYGTISVTDCRKVDAIMRVLDVVHNKYRLGTDVGSDLQVLDGYDPVVFFDFADYVHRLCASDAELTKWFNDALSQLVPYERHTEYYFSSLTYAGEHRINTCCGLTISAPSTNTMVVNSKPKSHFYALFR